MDFSDPETDKFFRDVIKKQLHLYIHLPDKLNDYERYTSKVAYHYYPNDPIKRENVLYVFIRASFETQLELNLGIPNLINEDKLFELAKEYGVEEPFLEELKNIQEKNLKNISNSGEKPLKDTTENN